jgi:hypothetical protein
MGIVEKRVSDAETGPTGQPQDNGKVRQTIQQSSEDALAGSILFRALSLQAQGCSLSKILMQLSDEFPEQAPGMRAVEVLMTVRGTMTARKAVATKKANKSNRSV